MGGLVTFRLTNFLLNARNPALRPDRLFIAARSSYRRLFGDAYPTEEIKDDLENYRALEFIHQDFVFRYRIWQAAEASERGEDCAESSQAIWDDIEYTGEVIIPNNSFSALAEYCIEIQ